jgi:hypothetical protein
MSTPQPNTRAANVNRRLDELARLATSLIDASVNLNLDQLVEDLELARDEQARFIDEVERTEDDDADVAAMHRRFKTLDDALFIASEVQVLARAAWDRGARGSR